jgi:26S proteasome regulatory subunit T5
VKFHGKAGRGLAHVCPFSQRMERDIFGDEVVEDALGPEFETMSAEGISQRARLLENELRVLKDESTRLSLETNNLKEKIKENKVRWR